MARSDSNRPEVVPAQINRQPVEPALIGQLGLLGGFGSPGGSSPPSRLLRKADARSYDAYPPGEIWTGTAVPFAAAGEARGLRIL